MLCFAYFSTDLFFEQKKRFFCKKNFFLSVGGLDLSWHAFDRDSRSRHIKNRHLNCRENLDCSKTDISTVEKISTAQKPSLDSFNHPKNQDFSIFVKISIKISISTVQKPTSRLSRKSWQFEKGHLDVSRHLNLYLDWSQLSRLPGLLFLFFVLTWKTKTKTTPSPITFWPLAISTANKLEFQN